MPRTSTSLTTILLCAFAMGGAALAIEKTFPKPKHGANRLDWCLNWGTDCGKPVANAFCKAKGYEKAKAFGIAKDIGAATPTRLISTGAVCDEPHCDGFTYITCEKAQIAMLTVLAPKYKGNRLDWCVDWSVGCGQQAATAFCKSRGFKLAVAFKIAPDIGAATPTRLIGTGAVCDQNFCDGFSTITCKK